MKNKKANRRFVGFKNIDPAERKTLIKESKDLYLKIYNLTLKIYGVPTATMLPCSGYSKCWLDILDIWKANEQKVGYNILYASIYHIAWDKYPVENIKTNEKELLELVERAVLNEGYAYETWAKSKEFVDALHEVLETTYKHLTDSSKGPFWFARYVFSRTLSMIKFKSKNLMDTYEGMYVKESTVMFEGAIRKLIPTAKNWDAQMWLDEKAIMDKIYKAHGIDYSKDYGEFDSLIDVFSLMLDGRSYDRSLMLIKSFPESMAASLWPKNTDDNVERFFTRICNRCSKISKKSNISRSKFRRDVITNSWVYSQYHNGTRTPSKIVLKKMFELGLGI